MDTIIITTISKWYDPPRIRHQVALELSKNYRVLFVETPTQWIKKYDTIIDQVEPNIYRVRLTNKIGFPERLTRLSSRLRNITDKYLLRQLSKVINEVSTGSLILINFNYNFLNIMNHCNWALKVYFCNDDFASMAKFKIFTRKISELEQQVANAADLCITVSEPLLDKLKRINDNTYLLLPGHSFIINPNNVKLPNNKDVPIKIGFMGYINARLEFEWLRYAGYENDIEVHLIGPIEYIEEDKTWFIYGAKYGTELQSLLEQMDVLVMPYRTSLEYANSITAPNKFFSYLAVGKPIVISDMPNFIDLGPGIIYRANTKEDFVDKIRIAYYENRETFILNRLELASQNTWEIRGKELKSIIENNIRRYK